MTCIRNHILLKGNRLKWINLCEHCCLVNVIVDFKEPETNFLHPTTVRIDVFTSKNIVIVYGGLVR